MLVTFIFGIGERVTIVLPIFFYHNSAESLPRRGLGRVVTPSGRQGTVEKVVKKIHELGQQGVQFATFPETIIPYYPYFSYVLAPFALAKEHLRLLEESVTVPSAETRAIGEAAKEANMVVSIGVNERDGGSIYNTQLLFDADGTLIQRRRKTTPTYTISLKVCYNNKEILRTFA
jgi:predicted amidohydrolase